MKIVIVGGGSSGWMTAAAFCKTFPDWDITIITGGESIGVGESTTPHINQYLSFMGITDEVFLPAARATYKSSSRFDGFVDIGKVFHYPNGQAICRDIPFYKWMEGKALYPDECPPFADMMMPFVTIAEEGKLALDNLALGPYKLSKDRSFHIDATSFAKFLKETFCQKIHHIDAKVKEVVRDIIAVKKLKLEHHGDVYGDLFIDCTGQQRLLIGPTTGWVNYDTILNDTALVVKQPYKDKQTEMVPYTNAKAMSSGWQWTIPTWDFISRGYVFSSKHQSLDSAKNEFGYQDPKVIKFKNGRMQKAWTHNIVSIGLSFGFIEPLESTSLFNTHHGILALMDILMTEKLPGQFARDRFNLNLTEHLDGWKEFVEAHYYYSARRDTPYWRDVTEKVSYSSGETHSEVIRYMITNETVKANPSPIIFILAGSGYTTFNKRKSDFFEQQRVRITADQVKNWQQVYQMRRALAHEMPTMCDYLSSTFDYKNA